jgi:predicted acetyltransferase
VPELSLPRVAAVPSFVEATRRDGGEDHPDYDLAAARAQTDPQRHVDGLLSDVRERRDRPAGWVPSTHLWLIDGDDYLGRLQIRHRLNEYLREQGGHVGYYVVPTHRGRGHASAMFAASLAVAFAVGIDCALVTCDSDNVASRRVIERHGGLLQDERGGKLRFWVPTF